MPTPRKQPTSLGRVLEETRPAIERGLAEAEEELDELNGRRAELEALIGRARLLLADQAPTEAARTGERLTLHAAMERVLDENENRWMTVHEIADVINERQLYEKRDRSPVEPSQIHARAGKYHGAFEKAGPRVRRVTDS